MYNRMTMVDEHLCKKKRREKISPYRLYTYTANNINNRQFRPLMNHTHTLRHFGPSLRVPLGRETRQTVLFILIGKQDSLTRFSSYVLVTLSYVHSSERKKNCFLYYTKIQIKILSKLLFVICQRYTCIYIRYYPFYVTHSIASITIYCTACIDEHLCPNIHSQDLHHGWHRIKRKKKSLVYVCMYLN